MGSLDIENYFVQYILYAGPTASANDIFLNTMDMVHGEILYISLFNL